MTNSIQVQKIEWELKSSNLNTMLPIYKLFEEPGCKTLRKNKIKIPNQLKKIPSDFASCTVVQNLVSFLFEEMSGFQSIDKLCEIIQDFEEEYMPSGPPMSPITGSYFAYWSLFDLKFGEDNLTFCDILIEMSELFEFPHWILEVLKAIQRSRMGIYEQQKDIQGTIQLKELYTEEVFSVYNSSGYKGSPSELWFVRLIKDMPNGNATIPITPYILRPSEKKDWMNLFLEKFQKEENNDFKPDYNNFLKYGNSKLTPGQRPRGITQLR